MGTPEQSHLLTPPFSEDLLTGKSVCTENNLADGYDWGMASYDNVYVRPQLSVKRLGLSFSSTAHGLDVLSLPG